MRGRGLMLVAGMRAGERRGEAQAQQQQAAKPPAPQQQPPPAQPVAPTQDVTAELQRLANLHSQGVLTDQEFADAKKKLLV